MVVRVAPSVTGSRIIRAEELISDFGINRCVFIVRQSHGISSLSRLLNLQLDGFHFTVLFNKFVSSHISTANTNQNLIIHNFDLDSFGAEKILTFRKSLNLQI